MALLETEFGDAIEGFASHWQKAFDENAEHGNGDWDDVRVLERVGFLGHAIAVREVAYC